MKIGIISDTHGQSARLKTAINKLISAGAETLVHCGDIEHPEDLITLASQKVPAHLAAGNCDKPFLQEFKDLAVEYNLNFAPDFVAILIEDGQFLAATHGHLQNLVAELIAGEQFPFVCLGHSHIRRDEKIGATRVLNPGSIYNPRKGNRSCMLLDTKSGKAEYFEIQ